MSQPDYNHAFHDGAVAEYTIQHDSGADATTERYTLRLHTPGELVVTSGHIFACDPLAMMPDTPPLADTVPPGRYPVILSVAELPDGDQRVAYALLRLGEQPAVRWEMAVPRGRTLGSLEPGHFFGYPVDSGKGCFMDADAARALVAPVAPTPAGKDTKDASDEPRRQLTFGVVPPDAGKDAKHASLDDKIFDLLDKTYVPTWSWANLVMDDSTGANVIVFSSGWGDGFYPSYWGYDAADQRVALVTDFGVVDESWLAR